MIKFLKRKNLIKAHGHTDCNKHNCDGILVKAWCSCDAWQVSEADKYRDTDALDLIQAGMYGIGGRCAIRRNELFSLQLSNEATVGFGLVLFFCSTGNG